MCLDTLQKNEGGEIPLSAFACQNGVSTAQVSFAFNRFEIFNIFFFLWVQMFSLSKTGELRRELSCATVIDDTDGETWESGKYKVARLVPCSVMSKKNAVEFKWKLEKVIGFYEYYTVFFK